MQYYMSIESMVWSLSSRKVSSYVSSVDDSSRRIIGRRLSLESELHKTHKWTISIWHIFIIWKTSESEESSPIQITALTLSSSSHKAIIMWTQTTIAAWGLMISNKPYSTVITGCVTLQKHCYYFLHRNLMILDLRGEQGCQGALHKD